MTDIENAYHQLQVVFVKIAALPERWLLHTDNLKARRRLTARDRYYIEGYNDAMNDCAAWLSKLIYEANRR